MSAVREAFILPLLFLTIVLFGGLDAGAPNPWTPPSLAPLRNPPPAATTSSNSGNTSASRVANRDHCGVIAAASARAMD